MASVLDNSLSMRETAVQLVHFDEKFGRSVWLYKVVQFDDKSATGAIASTDTCIPVSSLRPNYSAASEKKTQKVVVM